MYENHGKQFYGYDNLFWRSVLVRFNRTVPERKKQNRKQKKLDEKEKYLLKQKKKKERR